MFISRFSVLFFISLLFASFYSCREPKIESYGVLSGPSSEWLAFMDLKTSFLPDSVFSPSWTWQFQMGRDSGWTDVPLPDFSESEFVKIPHRLFAPNTAFWYRYAMVDTFINEPIFYINADDGAQFFLNGQRVPAQNTFFYAPGSLKKGDEIVLRVLNDAGSGGIRALHILEKDTLNHLIAQYAKQLDSTKLVLKVLQHLPHLVDQYQDKHSLLSNDAAQPIIRNKSLPYFLAFPFLSGLDNGGYRVSWECPAVKESFIEVQLKDGTFKIISAIPRETFFDVTFTKDFWADSVFGYRVILDGTHASEFIELPKSTEVDFLSAAVWSDSQGGWSVFSRISPLINDLEPDVQIGLGDLVSNGSLLWQWWSFFVAGSEMFSRIPGLFIPGNHDYDGYYEDGKALLIHNYLLHDQNNPVRFQRIKNVGFLIIDLNANFPIGVWAKEENRIRIKKIIHSDSWKEATWKVLLVHQPTYGEGGYDGEPASRDVILGIRKWESQIDLVLSGHNHVYERKHIVLNELGSYLQLTLGGAGGSLNEADPNPPFVFVDTLVQRHHFSFLEFKENELAVKILSPDNTPIDSFVYSKIKAY